GGRFQHATAIADNVGADGRAKDDHELPWLPEHFDVPAHRRITAENARKHKDNTDNETHRTRPDAILKTKAGGADRACLLRRDHNAGSGLNGGYILPPSLVLAVIWLKISAGRPHGGPGGIALCCATPRPPCLHWP